MPTIGSTVQQVGSRKPASTEDFLKILGDDTFNVLMGVEARSRQEGPLDQKLDQLEQGITEAMTKKDETLKRARLQIVEADAAKLREAVAKEEQDLAVAMVGLRELMDQLGVDYTALTQPTSEETAIVTRASAAVRQAEFDLQLVGRGLFGWYRKGHKLAQANLALAEARSRLESAEVESKRLARSRLMNATLDRSLSHYTTQVARVIDIMTNRKKDIEVQLAGVSKRRQQALEMKQQASRRVEELDLNLNELEQGLKLAEQELAGLTHGSSQHVAKETEVSNLRNRVETIRGDRNTALAVFQSKERFAEELQIHETTQRKLRDNQTIWIAILRSDTQERLTTFASRLEAMKGMADQQVAQGMDQIGTEIDGRNAETLARIGATSDRIRMDMVEAHPERVRRILNAAGAQAEAIARLRERELEAIAAFRDHYGIDPKATSFFSFEEAPASA